LGVILSQGDLSRISASGKRWVWSLMELQQKLDLIFDVDAAILRA
jgi:hypothetical protein